MPHLYKIVLGYSKSILTEKKLLLFDHNGVQNIIIQSWKKSANVRTGFTEPKCPPQNHLKARSSYQELEGEIFKASLLLNL